MDGNRIITVYTLNGIMMTTYPKWMSAGRCKCKRNNNNCGPGCKCVGCCNMPKGVSPGQANVEQEDVDTSESEDDLMEDVDDVMNSVFGTDTYESECDGDTSICEANSDTDINTSDDNMKVDTTR